MFTLQFNQWILLSTLLQTILFSADQIHNQCITKNNKSEQKSSRIEKQKCYMCDETVNNKKVVHLKLVSIKRFSLSHCVPPNTTKPKYIVKPNHNVIYYWELILETRRFHWVFLCFNHTNNSLLCS